MALLPEFFPRLFKNENWRVKHQILYYLLILIIISTLNGLYINYLENLAFSWANYWWIIKRTVMLGAIPLCFLILIDHNLKLTKYLNLVRELRLHLNNIDKTSFKQKHKLKSHSDFKKIMIDEKSFKYAESEGNYSTIFSQINQSEEKSLQRISLNYIEENITSSHIIRCHRSYIVNLYMVTQITGNAQGLKLEIENSEKKIPVSRKYIPIIKSFLSNQ
ncbi:MAG: LytTR family transcriptional regulator [Bacteroidia bacterium]|nr:LytTR family transcriptional regulator [Bacteroidia bacterium]MBT8269130.1 LytTR family transcriptional regulator [Bacteroidia bacterium]